MGAINPADLIRDAREMAREELRARSRVRLSFSVRDDEMWSVTSPDVDWLHETAHSHGAAKMKAMTAVLRVANWCGVEGRQLPR